jgi:3-methyladenine DNA glycosylase AlkD
MTLRQVMQTLESMGTAQNRRVYARHGAGQNQFGVSFANLNKLARKINKDHALAEALMRTGNQDARMLATMIADPALMDARQLDAWVKTIDYYVLADVFARNVASKSRFARQKAGQWSKSRSDFIGQVGWDLLGLLAMNDDAVPEEEFEARIRQIEARIHRAGNRTRHAMNMALIAIGMRSPRLKKLALAAASRIGKVEVDHGDTGCKTPDAAAYLAKVYERRAVAKGA